MIKLLGHKSTDIRKPTRKVIEASPLIQIFAPQEGKNLSATSAVLTLRFYSFFHKTTPVEIYKDLSQRVQKYFPVLTPDEYAIIAQSYHKIHIKPDFFGTFEKLATARLSEMSPVAKLHYLHGLGKIGHTIDDSSYEHINHAILAMPDILNLTDNQMLLWTLAILDSQRDDAPLWPAASHIMSRNHGMASPSNMAASLWFDIPYIPTRNKNDSMASGIEIQIRDIFVRAGAQLVPPEDHHFLGFQAPVDMKFAHNDKNIIVEFDGPYHFTKSFDGREHYNGSSFFNSRLMAKYFADRVVRIDYHSGNMLTDASKYLAEIFARSVLDKACQNTKGAYRAIITDHSVSLKELQPE